MSLTEEQVTCKNFQEYHKRILPYLNGSFPTPIVNKFSKGDLYSTEEKIIGQWIDGKPLWQKVWSGLSITGTAGDVDTNIDISFVDRLIRGAINRGGSGTATVGDVNFKKGTNNHLIYNEVRQFSNIDVIILQYTKTTDSPISIGDGNDYSTDEQVVGTWIDGKPVYQKTIYLSSASQNTEITIENLNVVVDYSGIFSLSGGNQFVMPYGYNGAEDVSMYVRNSDKKIIINSNFALVDLYMTVLYTKSTD